ncbi:MAG: HlyD family secretion protein [Chlamydiales bacterium]|jgi:HlyD family secretion protein
MSTNKKSSGRLFLIVVGLAVVALVSAQQAGLFESDEVLEIRGAPVRRGALEITITERGNLDAKNSYSMKSEVEGRSTILFLIDEGVYVKAGDLVAELDASQLVDKHVTQEITVQNGRAASTKANENLKIQEIENESLIAKAEQQVVFAGTDLEKFRNGDRPQQLEKAEEDILLSEEELKKAEDTLDWSRQLNEKGFVERTELEKDELAFKRAGILLEQAKRAQSLLQAYEQPKEEARLVGDQEEAERQLRKAALQAVAQLADYQAAKESATVRLKLEEDKLKKLEEQIAKARIIAPVDGMIVYGREDGGRYMGGGEPIKEGGEVRERQEIASIPGAGGMTVKASVHESVLKQVTEGLHAIVRIDAIPGKEFSGTVGKVARLPDKNSWFANPNLRLYRTDISIEGGNDDMRPGMSCNIEIQVEMIEDTLFVPLQSVHSSGGGNLCWVQDGAGAEERAVEVGQHNEKWVEILSGLREGEIVLLSAPPGFQAQDAPDSDELEAGQPVQGRPEGRAADDGADDGAGKPSRKGSGEGGGNTHGAGAKGERPAKGTSHGSGQAAGGKPGGAGLPGNTSQ